MGSSMRKTTRREIGNSFGRYFAILAIIALGVGFFAGLTVTTPAMVQTGGAYMNDKELYDLRLLSTLGFEKDTPQMFADNDDVEATEGAVFSDFLAVDEAGDSFVLTAQTLLEVQNQVELVEGRLPQNAGECVVDANVPEISVGDKIRVSEENDEDITDLFSNTEYEVVGTVNSSYYVNYERGSSSLGNGKVKGFVYLLPEGFDTEFYTEIFIRLKQDYEVYSDEYKAVIDELKGWAEPLTDEAAQIRYENILADANEKIADAEAELEEKTADAKADLAEAEKKIADGEADLADAQEKIADGKKQLADARTELADKKKEVNDSAAKLADARAQVEDGLAQIAQARQQLEAAMALAGAQGVPGQLPGAAGQQGMAGADAQQMAMDPALQLQQLQAQDAELQAKLVEIEAGEAQISEGRKQLTKAEKEIAEKEEELAENEQKLEDARKDLEEGRKEYEDGQQELEEKTAEAEEKIADAKAELADVEEPDTYVLGRDANIGYACFENDSAIVEGIAKLFPVFFFLVAVLVCVTTMNRMIEEQRTQIGILKALGYREGQIMGKYLYYSGSAAVIGSVIGYIAGSFIFPTVIWAAYKIMYRLGELRPLYDWKLAVISLAVALLCSMGTTWLTCRYELNSVAAQLIRPKAAGSGKRIFLERIPFLWKRLSFLVKVSIRNVFRYKQRFFMMVLGIGGCTALLLTGFGIKDTIADVATQQYEEIQIYELSVMLKDDFSAEHEIGAFLGENGIEEYAPVSEKALDLTGPEATKDANVIIPRDPEEITKFLNVHDQKKNPIPWPQKGEAVMNTKLAEKCGIRIGDTVSLRNDDGEKLTVKVTGLCRNLVYNYVYISPDTWEADNGELPEFKSLYVNAPDEMDLRALSEKLLSCEEVSAVSVSADFMERISNMMSSLDYIVLLVIICAGALAFIVIYNLTNINITERLREIATIKVLGFYPMETASYVFRENVVLTAVGALAGLVMGIYLHRFVMLQIDLDMLSFDIRILPFSYVKSVAMTFLFMVIVDVFMYLKLERIDMAESLKSVE